MLPWILKVLIMNSLKIELLRLSFSYYSRNYDYSLNKSYALWTVYLWYGYIFEISYCLPLIICIEEGKSCG